jgi:hypothetical protein
MNDSNASTLSSQAERRPNPGRSSSRRLACRQIGVDDVEAVLDLLCEGFSRLPRRHWVTALELMGARATPAGAPRYGYMIESDGLTEGVLLAITTEMRYNGTTTIRSNSSSWYVRPGLRTYASLLLTKWLRSPGDIHLSVSPAEHTFPLIEALGFVRFVNGTSLLFPAVTPRAGRIRILLAARLSEAELAISREDHALLVDHARAGCIALWCETRDRGYPFVFRRRLLKSRLPAAQLIYCRDLEDLAYLAAPIGRHLLRLGLLAVLAATNGPVSGVPGIYIDGKYPMYFRGRIPPRLGDLAYTEAGLFGF